METLPPFVLAERNALVAEVYEAFAGVSRKGGVSWSESDEVDNYGPPEARTLARAKDQDTSWMQVVEDPLWQGDTGIGGWNFLDSIGYRYYLPVQMIRCLWIGHDFGDLGIAVNLRLPEEKHRDWTLERWSLLDLRQRRCVKRFIEYMAVITGEAYCDLGSSDWVDAYDSYWKGIADVDELKIVSKRARRVARKPRF